MEGLKSANRPPAAAPQHPLCFGLHTTAVGTARLQLGRQAPRLQQQQQRCAALPALHTWQRQHLQQQQPWRAQQPAQPQQLRVLQQQRPCSPAHGLQPQQHAAAQQPGTCRAAASSQAFSDDSNSGGKQNGSSGGVFAAAATLTEGLADTVADLQDLAKRFMGLWRQFLPMLSLFFCLSFINTMLDSLKDTLVITAAGGGAFVIPYLTVYAVLPLSMVFLVAFSAASQRMSRSALFNIIIAIFVAFFAGFALFLYPNADVLHPHALADQLQQVLPQGLAGMVGMYRNWTFTLFFCMSELWGDVCMGLLFWGLANEITNLSDAATLYPLFGLGANLAQALAGMVLKATTRGGAAEFAMALQASMAAVVCIACVAIMLQQHITNQAEAAAAAIRHRHQHRHNSMHSSIASGADLTRASSPAIDALSPSLQPLQQQQPQKKEKPKTSLKDSFRMLAASVEIRCLATMSLAQGLCNSLMEFAWKCHMRILYPSPADFTAFLGDVATWSGVVTGGLMLLSPLLFERLGWRGVAGATPKILLYGGSAFFAACIVYQHMFGHAVAAAGASAAGPAGVALLQGLVLFGALLYVFGRGAKFSLFKPAEEMVYITLDEEGRTRGKAAIDVVGSQTGKSGGSLLQQALLITSAGSIVGIMPVLFAFFFAMLRGWNSAVYTLSNVRHYSYDSPISSLDEDAEGGDGGGLSSGAGLTQQQQQEQQAASLAAAAAAAGGSSAGLTAADQQELLAKLQGLADGSGDAGTAAAAAAKPPRGSKSFEAAMARSSSGDGGQDSSSSSSGGSNGSEADVRLHHDGIGLNGAGSQQGGQDQQGAGNSQGFVSLSHDAASSFRRSRREAAGHSNAQDANSSSNSDSSMAPEVDADSSSSKSSSSSTSRVNQARDGGST